MTKTEFEVSTFAPPRLKKVSRLTASPFPIESPLPRIPPTLQKFFHPCFLGIFGKVNCPPLNGRGAETMEDSI